MALNLINTNFNGRIFDRVTTVLGLGNEIVQKGIAEVIDGITEKGLEIPVIRSGENPLGAFVDGELTVSTFDGNKKSRILTPTKSTMGSIFKPFQFIPEWDKLRSSGTLTEAELNVMLFNAWMDANESHVGYQIAKNFFQGDTAGGDAALNRCDGLVKLIEADSDVIDVANIGEINKDSFFDILKAVYKAIPDVEKQNPDFKFLVNYSDWEDMELANIEDTKAYKGVLGMMSPKEFVSKRIEPLFSVPENTIIATIATNNAMSNLKMGYYFSENQEAPIVGRHKNSSNNWFVRADIMFGVQYSVGEKIVYYKGEGVYTPLVG